MPLKDADGMDCRSWLHCCIWNSLIWVCSFLLKFICQCLEFLAIYFFCFRIAVYISLLVGAKFLRAVGLFLAYDVLKLVPVVLFLFVIKAG